MLPHPLFDTLENVHESLPGVLNYIKATHIENAYKEHQLCLEFLKSYGRSRDTFNAYRREVERVLHWSWQICKKSLKEISRNDIREYFTFVVNPPKNWIATKTVARFVLNDVGLRVANPVWRPFVTRLNKAAMRLGKNIDISNYQLSNKSIEAIFASLSSLFTFLQQENYLEVNPISLVRQKKGLIQRQQTRRVHRKLSHLQWSTVVHTAEKMAVDDPQHERTLFLISIFYLLGVRISELSFSAEREATMGHFAPDKSDLWWFTTIGKGNKIRDIAVPDALLLALKRYRKYLDLSPLPKRDEPTPLFPKMKGKNGLGARQIRNLVQMVFDQAIKTLQIQGKTDEALDLATATVHWIRHTMISREIEFRPREHIRDDVGHENAATMDKYIDIDRTERHLSAKNKTLIGE